MKIKEYTIAALWGIAGTVIMGLGLLIGYWIKSGYKFPYTMEIRDEMIVYAEMSPVAIVITAAITYFGRKKNRRGDNRD